MQERNLTDLMKFLGAPGGQLAYGLPPFAFNLEVPPDWHVFNAEPGLLRQDVERACQATPGWRTLDAATQVSIRRMMTETVHEGVRAGVVLTTMSSGARIDGRGQSFINMTLSWMRVRPFEADLDYAHLAAGSDGYVREFEGAVGTCVLTAAVHDTGSDGLNRPGGSRLQYDVQAFVPISGTEWMAIVSGTTAEKERAEVLEKAVARMATSIVPNDAELAALRSTKRAEGAAAVDAAIAELVAE